MTNNDTSFNTLVEQSINLSLKAIAYFTERGFTSEQLRALIQAGVRDVSTEENLKTGYYLWDKQKKQHISADGIFLPGVNQVRFLELIEANGKKVKCITQAGQPMSALNPNALVITEGYADAMAGTIHGGILTGALPGVSGARKLLKPGSKQVILFDSDGWHNPGVFSSLFYAGLHTGGKINLLPEMPEYPKGGLCEYFLAGYTAKDYENLIKSAYTPKELLLEWPNHWENLPDKQLSKAVRLALRLGAEYLDELELKALLSRIKKATQLDLTTLKQQLKKQKAKIQAQRQKTPDYANPIEPAETIEQIVFKALYSVPPWVCIDSKLHRFNSKFYEHVDDKIELKRIADFLNSFPTTSMDGSRYAYANAHIANSCLNWAKARLAIDPRLVNPPGLNLDNGVLEITLLNGKITPQLKPHSPNKIYTYCSKVAYNPLAPTQPCDRLLECLDPTPRDIFLKTIAASLDMDLVRKVIGRGIRGLLMWGGGNNGKDALLEAVRALYGGVGVTSNTLTDFQQYDQGRQFTLANLEGARISWSSENGDFVRLDKLQSLKAAITGNTLMAERKGKDAHPFTPKSIFLFNINNPPNLSAAQEAIRSRWGVIPFTKTFVTNPNPLMGELKADPRFAYDWEWMQTEVVPALLNKLIESLQKLIDEGIDWESCNDAINEIQSQSSHLFRFCQEMGVEYQPGAKTYTGDIWKILKEWYVADGTLSIEIDSKGKEKLIWSEQSNRFDKNVKGANQVISRFQELFPKAKRGADTTGERKNQTYLLGVAISGNTPLEEGISKAIGTDGKPMVSQLVSPEALLDNDSKAGKPVSSNCDSWAEKNISDSESPPPEPEIEKNNSPECHNSPSTALPGLPSIPDNGSSLPCCLPTALPDVPVALPKPALTPAQAEQVERIREALKVAKDWNEYQRLVKNDVLTPADKKAVGNALTDDELAAIKALKEASKGSLASTLDSETATDESMITEGCQVWHVDYPSQRQPWEVKRYLGNDIWEIETERGKRMTPHISKLSLTKPIN